MMNIIEDNIEESVEEGKTASAEQSTSPSTPSFNNTPEAAVEEAEQKSTDTYTNHFGLNQVPYLRFAEIQQMLTDVESNYGIKPAFLYASFQPAQPHASQPGQVLWEYNQNGAQSTLPSDELELRLLTATGNVIIQRIPGATRANVRAVARELRLSTRNRNRTTAFMESAQQLYQWIIAPLEEELEAQGVENLSLILDRGLLSLPFAAFHDGEEFLIEKYSLGLIPSASFIDPRPWQRDETEVLAMGAESFTTLESLPSVPVEVERITQTWPGESFLNEEFSVQNLQRAREKNDYNIIHLATHAEFNPGRPSNSYIQFSDQRLTLDRLPQLKLDDPVVDLLVLSACQTALGDPDAELGFAGLSIMAGVKSALGSLWSVNDLGTLALMTHFYDSLQDAPIKAEALRQAQLAMLRGEVQVDGERLRGPRGNVSLPTPLQQLNDVNLNHPYFWSGFTMIGSPW
ncbi:CHAT domain-containing protein [Spirulina sp. CS-785/01]|uniref:CHAT domain-containing protein n=1 Tax=Spirulina sp. CS-785/01 TaxID=3021716 RepID=UPI00232F90A0|nr:CHAT domain-containing protein [Spirulina sp. CS-785/01]MDB9314601.1 CHAT domain-containing protein [Spirulina sp. CS-785/01]